MGVKRPFEEENLPELSFEQPKQPRGSVMEDVPDGSLEGGSKDGSPIVDEGLEARAPSSSATSSSSSSSEEDVGNRDPSSCSNVPGRLDSDMPWRPPNQFDGPGPYAYRLNVPPVKEVPVGPEHQAEVPMWDPSASGRDIPGSSNSSEDEWEQRMMGTCIIPMHGLDDSSIDGESTVGRGGSDCSCADKGFPRCMQQHVKEARDKLQESIGEETFTELGFEEMGVEVACRWTDDEEKLFYEVVVSNPASHGRDFWKQLSAVFPTRTKRELVSYYFNVFVLFRRAVQNRSFWPIDSDNDEEPGAVPANLPEGAEEVDNLQHNHEDAPPTGEGDEDSEDAPSTDEDLFAGSVGGFGLEPKK